MKVFTETELNECISRIRGQWWEQFRETTFVSGSASITAENDKTLIRSVRTHMYLFLDNAVRTFSNYIPNDLLIDQSTWTLHWPDKVSFDKLSQFEVSDFDETKFNCMSIEWDDPTLPDEVLDAALLHLDGYGIAMEFQDADQSLDEFASAFPNRLRGFVRDCIKNHVI